MVEASLFNIAEHKVFGARLELVVRVLSQISWHGRHTLGAVAAVDHAFTIAGSSLDEEDEGAFVFDALPKALELRHLALFSLTMSQIPIPTYDFLKSSFIMMRHYLLEILDEDLLLLSL